MHLLNRPHDSDVFDAMVDWERAVIQTKATILDAMQSIEAGELQIALMIDENDRLIGVVTDGDLRRSILQGASLSDSVFPIINTSPVVANANESRDTIAGLMRTHDVQQIPLIDGEGRLIGIELLTNLVNPPKRSNPVVIMAGGLGTRLRPLTNDRPKPLIEVGGQPILQTVLDGFRAQGFHQFYLSVNYKSWMIEDFFGDGSKWDISIDYLRETKQLGTAGSLTLLPKNPSVPVLVANGDLLTDLNFARLLDYHREQNAVATMGVRQYNLQVPYGVIEINGQCISNIQEKPTEKYFVNAGLYVLEPEAIAQIPQGQFYDMPELLEKIIAVDKEVAAFPIQEYWQDIGQPDDLNQAKEDFPNVFAALA